MGSDIGDREPSYRTLNRRRLLATSVAVGASALAGCGGGDGESTGGDGGGVESEASGGDTADDQTDGVSTVATDSGGSGDGCTPAYSDGDSACQQVADATAVLTAFPVAGTVSVVAFDHPCGWQASTTDQYEDRFQANSTRNGFGADGEAYVDVQIRVYYQPVSEGFIDEERTSGNYDDVSYEYDGGARTAIVSSASSAAYGTVAHAAVPYGERLAHVEFVSTFKGATCDVEPRPDYDVVVAMVESLGANPDTTFAFA